MIQNTKMMQIFAITVLGAGVSFCPEKKVVKGEKTMNDCNGCEFYNVDEDRYEYIQCNGLINNCTEQLPCEEVEND